MKIELSESEVSLLKKVMPWDAIEEYIGEAAEEEIISEKEVELAWKIMEKLGYGE